MKINQIIELSSAFSAEVNLGRDFDYVASSSNRFIDGYLPNASSRLIMRDILDTLSARDEQKVHLITASYGTGKSYMLLVLAYLLGKSEGSVIQEFQKKINDKEDYYQDGFKQVLSTQTAAGSPYLIVTPNYGTDDFDQAMLAALNSALEKNDIRYKPKTHYFRAAETLEKWKAESSSLYEQFMSLITGSTDQDFIRLLKECDGASYELFKQTYSKVVHSEFSETHGDVYDAFAQTALKILDLGYKGIVVLYDEFGTILYKLINKPAQSRSLNIQDFLERLKDRKSGNANIIFIAASHQDPTDLQEDKTRDIRKIISRFQRHRLEVADSENEELMGKVFITINPEQKSLLLSQEVIDGQYEKIDIHTLYSGKGEEWIRNKIVKDLYPLHPLTAFILPRLSNEYAQNTRSMFNFLSPNERREGCLRSFIDQAESFDKASSRLNLFTPDKLFSFFEQNLTEAKSEIVSGIVDSYKSTLAKSKDPVIERLMRNLLILTTTREAALPASFEMLEWAMEDISYADLRTLLNDLVQNEILEFNENLKTFEFPAFNSKSLSKINKEVKNGLSTPTLEKCKNQWDLLVPLEANSFEEHNRTYGTNRSFATVAICSVDELELELKRLRDYYNWDSKDFSVQGLILHFITDDEGEVEAFRKKIEDNRDLMQYLVFAFPASFTKFNELKEKTYEFFVLNETSRHPEVLGNANHGQRIKQEISRLKTELAAGIKLLYGPENWLWSFASLANPVEVKSLRSLERKLETLIDELFNTVPKIMDTALWFHKLRATDSQKVIEAIIVPKKNDMQLINKNNQSVESRIIERFFENSGLVKYGSPRNKIHYGEIKVPDTGSPAEQFFKLFDKSLTPGIPVSPEVFVRPLLNAPYGLSEQIIKMFFTCYLRANQESLHIVDAKKPNVTFEKEPALIEDIFKRPQNFAIRKVDLTIFQIRYLRALNTLFLSQGEAATFGELSKRFERLLLFFSNLNWAQIKLETQASAFYNELKTFLEQAKDPSVDREKEALVFFMESLPDYFLGLSQSAFEDNDENIQEVVKRLKTLKEDVVNRENDFKREVILNLSIRVFDKNISSPEEFKKVVKDWFDGLSAAARRFAVFENEKITLWLKALRSDDAFDVFTLYLDELAAIPIRDWSDISFEQSILLNQVEKFKKEIESYKGSPLAPYQRIARACFSLSDNDCSTEAIFQDVFKNWWESLEVLTKNQVFEDELLNVFVEEMKSDFNTKTKFLVNIPIKWKSKGFTALINTEWENWSPTEIRDIAEQYSRCVNALNEWKPPIAESELFEGISSLFLGKSIKDSQVLQNELLSSWYTNLPENTKLADWNAAASEKSFIDALHTTKFRDFLVDDLPKLLGLKAFSFWSQETLDNYLDSLQVIKENIEHYRRPLIALIAEIERKQALKSQSLNEFRMSLKTEMEALEVFKTNADKDSQLGLEENVKRFMALVRKLHSEQDLWNMVNELGKTFEIQDDYFFWTPAEQTSFVKFYQLIIKFLKSWRYPEDKQLQQAKERIAQQLLDIQSDMSLSKSQLVKLLQDLIEEQLEGKR